MITLMNGGGTKNLFMDMRMFRSLGDNFKYSKPYKSIIGGEDNYLCEGHKVYFKR